MDPHHSPPPNPLGTTLAGFREAAMARGFGTGQAERAYRGFFRAGPESGDPELAVSRGPSGKLTLTRYAGTSPTRRRIIARATIAPIAKEASEEVPEGTTTKFCQRLDEMPRPPQTGRAGDSHFMGVLKDESSVSHLDIESVIIPMRGRTGTRTNTLCISSQVGCAMNCGFCETAQMGLIRSLSAEEIVGQWWAATHLKRARINNIVFMGMGEPLDNAAEVIRAISVLTDHNGPGVPMANITISTVGRIDGLRTLDRVVKQDGWHRLGLAVSINAPNDEIRSRIMPINRAMPMLELREALLGFRRGSNRKLCFEYVLIPGVNDAEEHALELAEYLRPFSGEARASMTGRGRGTSPTGVCNVIPYNPRRDSPWPAPTEESVERFMARLAEAGVFVKRRRTKGRDVMAACGQLGTEEIRRRKYVPITVAV